nr:hypothetical protein [Tanacetum cinerariifolium]
MRTRSQSRSCNNSPQREAILAIVEPLRIEFLFLKDQFQEDPPPESPMADNRTMAELLQAPTEGYEDAIIIPEITANNFKLKHGLINLVQKKQFFRHDKEDSHAHIRYFNKITSTMRVPNVPSSSIKLMLFPFLLEGAAWIWLEKEPPRSIQTWDDLVSKDINQFFPPSKTTNLCNEITRFQQRFDDSFYEAWERFNDLLRAYKMPRECLKIIKSKSKVRQSRAKAVVAKICMSSSTPAISSDIAELKDMVKALLEGAARIWLEKEPPRSIQTWDDLVSKFINQFFPPSKTKNLRNEITRFQQRFDESFYEAWERFNDLLRACPHHRFSKLHQLDTFYNALNVNDQDSLNSAAGGNFLDKMPRECLKIIESKYKVRQTRDKAVVAKNQSSAPTPSTNPAPVKAVESSCVTCGGAHSYQNCPATQENAYRDNIQEYMSQAAAANYNQGNIGFRPQMAANQIRPLGFPPHQNNQNNFNQGNNFYQNRGGNFNQSNPSSFNQGQLHRPQVNQASVYQAPIPQTQRVSQLNFESYVKAKDAILRNMQSQGQSTQNQCQNIQNQNQNLQNQMATLTKMMSKLISANTASSYRSGTLPGPKSPSPSKQGTKVTKDQVQTTSSQSTAPVQPSVIQSESQDLVSEPVVAPVSAPVHNLKPSIPYPSRLENEKRHDQANEQIKKFYEIFKEMSFEISFTDALILMPKFASTLKALIGNKEKLSEMARTMMNEHCSAVILNKLPRKLGDPG